MNPHRNEATRWRRSMDVVDYRPRFENRCIIQYSLSDRRTWLCTYRAHLRSWAGLGRLLIFACRGHALTMGEHGEMAGGPHGPGMSGIGGISRWAYVAIDGGSTRARRQAFWGTSRALGSAHECSVRRIVARAVAYLGCTGERAGQDGGRTQRQTASGIAQQRGIRCRRIIGRSVMDCPRIHAYSVASPALVCLPLDHHGVPTMAYGRPLSHLLPSSCKPNRVCAKPS